MKKQDLIKHFTSSLNQEFRGWIGAEVETHFVDSVGQPITTSCSQDIFKGLEKYGWQVFATKGSLVTELRKGDAKILYDLGRQNIEISGEPATSDKLWDETMVLLHELYCSAEQCRAYPLFEPIVETSEDLLIIPDERDASWVRLDGKEALSLCAKTASVQFTIETNGPQHAIEVLNYLADKREEMLARNPYPQESMWRKYIATSLAGYRNDRYGVVRPSSIEDYVEMLSRHCVVMNGKLIPFEEGVQDIDLFIRSVWWNFRLRRYNNRLCIEIRTLARRTDKDGQRDLDTVLSILKPLY